MPDYNGQVSGVKFPLAKSGDKEENIAAEKLRRSPTVADQVTDEFTPGWSGAELGVAKFLTDPLKKFLGFFKTEGFAT